MSTVMERWFEAHRAKQRPMTGHNAIVSLQAKVRELRKDLQDMQKEIQDIKNPPKPKRPVTRPAIQASIERRQARRYLARVAKNQAQETPKNE